MSKYKFFSLFICILGFSQSNKIISNIKTNYFEKNFYLSFQIINLQYNNVIYAKDYREFTLYLGHSAEQLLDTLKFTNEEMTNSFGRNIYFASFLFNQFENDTSLFIKIKAINTSINRLDTIISEIRQVDFIKNQLTEEYARVHNNEAVQLTWKVNFTEKIKIYRYEEKMEDAILISTLLSSDSMYVDQNIEIGKRYFYVIESEFENKIQRSPILRIITEKNFDYQQMNGSFLVNYEKLYATDLDENYTTTAYLTNDSVYIDLFIYKDLKWRKAKSFFLQENKNDFSSDSQIKIVESYVVISNSEFKNENLERVGKVIILKIINGSSLEQIGEFIGTKSFPLENNFSFDGKKLYLIYGSHYNSFKTYELIEDKFHYENEYRFNFASIIEIKHYNNDLVLNLKQTNGSYRLDILREDDQQPSAYKIINSINNENYIKYLNVSESLIYIYFKSNYARINSIFNFTSPYSLIPQTDYFWDNIDLHGQDLYQIYGNSINKFVVENNELKKKNSYYLHPDETRNGVYRKIKVSENHILLSNETGIQIKSNSYDLTAPELNYSVLFSPIIELNKFLKLNVYPNEYLDSVPRIIIKDSSNIKKIEINSYDLSRNIYKYNLDLLNFGDVKFEILVKDKSQNESIYSYDLNFAFISPSKDTDIILKNNLMISFEQSDITKPFYLETEYSKHFDNNDLILSYDYNFTRKFENKIKFSASPFIKDEGKTYRLISELTFDEFGNSIQNDTKISSEKISKLVLQYRIYDEKKDLKFQLSQNYPNPFNPITNIDFSIKENEHTKLIIYNVLGQKVRTLINTNMIAGTYTQTWDSLSDNGKELPSGVYFYILSNGKNQLRKKLILIR